MKRVLFAMAVAFSIGAAARAHASACALDQYMHNGSVMDVQVCDGGVITISYATPRPGMVKRGVQSGTLLFDGFEAPGGTISGQSRLFSARCGVVAYTVTGSRQASTIVLSGTAPVRGRRCQVARYRQDTLIFSPLTASAPAAPNCPPGFAPSGDQCIRVGSGGAPGPVPLPGPAPVTGGWYVVAGSFKTRGEAQARLGQLGGGPWYVMNTVQCPNFRSGLWVATAGPFPKPQAQAFAARASQFAAYIKTCH